MKSFVVVASLVLEFGLFWLSMTWGGVGFHPPPGNNVTVELGQWNLARVCTYQKTNSMPNLVAKAPLVTSL